MVEQDFEITGDKLLTVAEAARLFRVSQETIRRAYRSQHLRVQGIGRHIRIGKKALIEWRENGCKTQSKQADTVGSLANATRNMR